MNRKEVNSQSSINIHRRHCSKVNKLKLERVSEEEEENNKLDFSQKLTVGKFFWTFGRGEEKAEKHFFGVFGSFPTELRCQIGPSSCV